MKKMMAMLLSLFMILSTAVIVVSAQEDITADPMTFALNVNTVNTIGSKIATNSTDTYVVIPKGGYAELIVNTEKAAEYELTVNASGKADGIVVSASANGTLPSVSKTLTVTNSYLKYEDNVLGNIKLASGQNSIVISNASTSVDSTIVTALSLKYVQDINEEDIELGPVTYPLNTTTVEDYSNAWVAQCSGKYITFSTGKGYIDYPVNIVKAGKYAFSVSSGASKTGVCLDVSVGGTMQIEKAEFPVVSGGYQNWADQRLGILNLTKGENVIRIAMNSGSADAAVMQSFTLEPFTEMITADTTEFALNKNTTQNFTGASKDYYADCITLWQGKSVEYVVTTEKAGEYAFALTSGTSSGATVNMVISVDGTEAITYTVTEGTGYGTRPYYNMGALTLKSGKNIIKIANASTSSSGSVVTKFKLTRLQEDITGNPMVFPLNNKTVDLSHADKSNSATTHATLQKGQYIEYTVNTKKDAYYLLTFNCSTGAGVVTKMDVSINGTLVLNDAPLADTDGHAAAKRLPHELGLVHLTPGANTLKFQTVGGAVVSSQFSLSKERLDQTVSVNGASLESTVQIMEAGMYGVTAKVESAENAVIRVSANGKAAVGKVNGAGDVYLGKIYLAEGAQTVKVATASGTAQIASVLLSDVEYDVSAEKTAKTFYIDKETVTTDIASGESSLAMTAGNSFTLSVNAEKAVCYDVSMTKSGSGKFTVNVNGYDQLTNAEGGVINLNRGENTVTFTLTEGEIAVEKLTLALADSFQNGAYTAWAQENRVVAYNFDATDYDNDGFYKSGTTLCTTMRDGTWLEYDVYTAEERYVNMSLWAASPDNGAFSVFVDGKTQMNRENTGTVSASYGTFAVCEMDSLIHIPVGYHVVRIQYHTHGLNAEHFTFADCGDDILRMENFRVETAEGARLPYVVKDGFTAYAKVDVLKLGNPTGEYRLMLAQYAPDKSLVDVSITEIDIAKLADKESKTFTAPLTYKGNGGWVKAFLVEKDTLAPQEKSIMYQDNLYFDEEVLEEAVSYTNTSNVLNGDGVAYADYSIHDENYDIDAIFYDSVVGQQSKVFAYIGVPKGATEENPVPAVVCVHGGNGIAFPEWVKLWNDKGYAAIAMTLTGDGPEASPLTGSNGSTVGEYPHPYKGIHCWGEQAFRADYETAAMYQNVLNVIRAHNVLRSYPGVDENNIGITGISWGGVTTTTVIGVDNRFKFAVPVYGCGYLDESETYFSSYFDKANNTVMWDPANFAARSKVPTLYLNSDSDQHFSINSTTKSCGVTDGSRMSIRNKYGHNYTLGWGAAEIYTFAKAMVEGYDPFITIKSEKAENGTFTATYTAPSGITAESAVLYYITEDALPYGGENNITWHKVSGGAIANGAVSFALPDEATFCYATVTDNNGSLISTKYIEVK
ncbi:MAG: acetylxylan esterase [Clostridia bacterium]|nr:acetylxylan esterase [Clostridia bacterium]